MSFLDYDSYIFDLDGTLFRGKLETTYPKNLIGDLRLKNNRIFDVFDNWIDLQDGVGEVLNCLWLYDKKIGCLSKGGLFGIEVKKQPAWKCLELFDISQYFNYNNQIIYKTDNKADFFVPNGRTVFIDDSHYDLKQVKKRFPEVRIINRNEFVNWTELME